MNHPPANPAGSDGPFPDELTHCPQCGKLLSATASTCLHCGKRLLQSTLDIPVIESSKRHTIRWIAIAVAALATGLIIVDEVLEWFG